MALTITVKPGEEIKIGLVTVRVISVRGKVRLQIAAPPEVKIEGPNCKPPPQAVQ